MGHGTQPGPPCGPKHRAFSTSKNPLRQSLIGEKLVLDSSILCPHPSQTVDLGERFRFLQSTDSDVPLAPISACLDLLSLLCIFSL